MCGCLCIGFIDFMLKSQKLLDCTNLLSPNKYIHSLKRLGRKNYIALLVVSKEYLKNLKYHAS